MAVKNHGISRELLIHPGETISDVLEERKLLQKELAQRAGVSEAFLSDVIHGRKDISKGLAIGLEYALGVPCSFWLNLQANYDAELLSIQEEETIQDKEKAVLSALKEVVGYLNKTKAVVSEATQVETIISLRKFFRVSNLTDLSRLVPEGAFRISGKATVNPYVLGAWLCICKILGEQRHVTSAFNPDQVDQLIAEIKQIMCNSRANTQKSLTLLLSQYGIDFNIVHNFRGAPVQGYIERKEDGSYRMVLTIRGAFADIFWFSLFHELGHIVNGDLSHLNSFIDADDGSDREAAADKFAASKLLDETSYQQFVNNGVFSYSAIERHAKAQGVPPFVVIGRLQKEGQIPWSRFTKNKPRYKWAE